MKHGKDLASLIAHAEGYAEDYPPLNEMTREAVAELIQNIHDFSDIWDDMSVEHRINAEKTLTDNLAVLDELGLHTYATMYDKPYDSPTGKWKMKTIVTYINPADKDAVISVINV